MLAVPDHVPVTESYNSAVAVGVQEAVSPPATRTLPSGSSMALWESRGVVIAPVVTHWPVLGSYNSALARLSPALLSPPATSTLPLRSSVAVKAWRAVFMLPVAVHVPGVCAGVVVP